MGGPAKDTNLLSSQSGGWHAIYGYFDEDIETVDLLNGVNHQFTIVPNTLYEISCENSINTISIVMRQIDGTAGSVKRYVSSPWSSNNQFKAMPGQTTVDIIPEVGAGQISVTKLR